MFGFINNFRAGSRKYIKLDRAGLRESREDFILLSWKPWIIMS